MTTITPSTKTSTKIDSGGASLEKTTYATSMTQETTAYELTDNGVGGFGAYGMADYAGKSVTVRLIDQSSSSESYKSDHEEDSTFTSGGMTNTESAKGGDYGETKVSEIMLAASTVSVSYARDFSDPVVGKHAFSPPDVMIDLCPYTSDYIVPGSVQFTWMGHVFADYGGALVRDRTPSDPGYLAGQIDYGTGIATVFDYVVGGLATAFTLDSCWTIRQSWTTASIFMRTQASPVKPTGFVMNLSDTAGNEIVASGDVNGGHQRCASQGHHRLSKRCTSSCNLATT